MSDMQIGRGQIEMMTDGEIVIKQRDNARKWSNRYRDSVRAWRTMYKCWRQVADKYEMDVIELRAKLDALEARRCASCAKYRGPEIPEEGISSTWGTCQGDYSVLPDHYCKEWVKK